MARWEEVIDHQVDLYNFWRSPLGKSYAEGFAGHVVDDDPDETPDERGRLRRLWAGTEKRAADFLFKAEPIWIEPDMMTLVEAAAEGFKPEPLHPNDLPTENGFLYLPRPVVIRDVRGAIVSFRAISWKVVNFIDGDLPVAGRSSGVWLFFYYQRGDPDDGDMVGEGLPRLQLSHAAPWVFGRPYFNDDESVRDVIRPAIEGIETIARFLGALFRVMSQTIALRTPMRASRSFRKRGAVLAVSTIVVVTLRKRRPDGWEARDDDHEAVDWSHRWLVSGHWRQQWYPSLGLHRQVWIGAYVKGPEDLPLIVRPHRVLTLTR